MNMIRKGNFLGIDKGDVQHQFSWYLNFWNCPRRNRIDENCLSLNHFATQPIHLYTPSNCKHYTLEAIVMTTQNTNKLAKADGSQPVLHQRGHEIQQYGSLVNPPIALSSDARSESCTLVNQILADTIILYHLYKKHHWMMRGHVLSTTFIARQTCQ